MKPSATTPLLAALGAAVLAVGCGVSIARETPEKPITPGGAAGSLGRADHPLPKFCEPGPFQGQLDPLGVPSCIPIALAEAARACSRDDGSELGVQDLESLVLLYLTREVDHAWGRGYAGRKRASLEQLKQNIERMLTGRPRNPDGTVKESAIAEALVDLADHYDTFAFNLEGMARDLEPVICRGVDEQRKKRYTRAQSAKLVAQRKALLKKAEEYDILSCKTLVEIYDNSADVDSHARAGFSAAICMWRRATREEDPDEEQRLLDQAETQLGRLITDDPNCRFAALAHLGIGTLRLLDDDRERALEALELALRSSDEASDTHRVALIVKSRYLAEVGRRDEAIEILEQKASEMRNGVQYGAHAVSISRAAGFEMAALGIDPVSVHEIRDNCIPRETFDEVYECPGSLVGSDNSPKAGKTRARGGCETAQIELDELMEGGLELCRPAARSWARPDPTIDVFPAEVACSYELPAKVDDLLDLTPEQQFVEVAAMLDLYEERARTESSPMVRDACAVETLEVIWPVIAHWRDQVMDREHELESWYDQAIDGVIDSCERIDRLLPHLDDLAVEPPDGEQRPGKYELYNTLGEVLWKKAHLVWPVSDAEKKNAIDLFRSSVAAFDRAAEVDPTSRRAIEAAAGSKNVTGTLCYRETNLDPNLSFGECRLEAEKRFVCVADQGRFPGAAIRAEVYESKFAIAKWHEEAKRYEEAVVLYRDVLFNHSYCDIAPYAALSYLELLEELQKRSTDPIPACRDELRSSVEAFTDTTKLPGVELMKNEKFARHVSKYSGK